jgi:DNA-binding NtrC family response regulator
MMQRDQATVLVVEDDSVIRDVFRGALAWEGYRVEASDDVPGAGAIPGPVSVAVILTDAYGGNVASPDLAFREPLRAGGPHAPVIRCSARARATRLDPDHDGRSAILPKPCDLADLRAAVERAMKSPGRAGTPTADERDPEGQQTRWSHRPAASPSSARPSGGAGRLNRKVVVSPGVLSAQIRPPWASTSPLLM